MGKNIIIAGAGHGGIVAGYYLAQNGYNVTVYEKNKRDKLGHPQFDSIHLDGFELSGIPVPEKYKVKRTPITFCIPGTDIPPVVQGDSGNTYNVEIDRAALYDHLIGLAEDAGVHFEYSCEIFEPIVLGSRVAGIKTSKGDIYGDVIIDACGLYSPLRSALPEFMNITAEPAEVDVLKSYRACFNRLKNAPKPEHKYLVSLITGEHCGILWVITNEDHVDVFIGSFYDIPKEYIEEKLAMLRSENPHIGKKLLRGGKITDIPVRQPLSVLVADGYAAIGDSAFMTIPVKGSGIGYSMRAGKILAECIENDSLGLYTAETLWEYQTRFFEEIGSGAAVLAAIKSLFLKVTLEDIEYIFGENIVSSELLEKFGNEAGAKQIIASLDLGALREKAVKVVGHPNIRSLLLSTGKNIAVYKLVEQGLKKTYSAAAVKKWAEGYDSFFDEISDPNSEQELERGLKAAIKQEKKKEKVQEKELKQEKKKEKKAKKAADEEPQE